MDKTEKFFYLLQAANASFVPSPSDDLSCTPKPLEPEPKGLTGPAGSYLCPCCGRPTSPILKEETIAYICPVCFWKNDVFDPDEDTPNDKNRRITLWQGRENYRKQGIVREDLACHARPPRPGEQPL